jgi:uncharacterized protein YebE (UPF0316 family)
MDPSVAITCLLIFVARIADVSLGTLRTVWLVQGRRTAVFFIGFVEVLIWVVAVSKVVTNLHEPIYAVIYSIGFASGNYVGITLEQRLAYGERAVRIFSKKGDCIAKALRDKGYGVTLFRGEGRDSATDMCFVTIRRRRVRNVVQVARELDPCCFYVVDEVQVASTALPVAQPTGWRAILKKK